MHKIFTFFNLFVVISAFILGILITKYEEKFNTLLLPENTVIVNEKAEPISTPVPGGININTATAEELCELHGIGKKLSARIIEYRETNGEFKICEDILKVSGIGKSLYDTISDQICVK